MLPFIPTTSHFIPPGNNKDTITSPSTKPPNDIYPPIQQYNLCNQASNLINLINNAHEPLLLHHELAVAISILFTVNQNNHAPSSPPGFVGTIKDKVTAESLEYQDLIKLNYHDLWAESFVKGLGHFMQGYKRTSSTNIIFFIFKSKVPPNCKVTYGWIV